MSALARALLVLPHLLLKDGWAYYIVGYFLYGNIYNICYTVDRAALIVTGCICGFWPPL